MRGRKTKQLRRTLIKKPTDTLVFLRSELGSKTEGLNVKSLWRNFKKLYLNGRVSEELLVPIKKKR